jgi:protein O-mannosyl-transferase
MSLKAIYSSNVNRSALLVLLAATVVYFRSLFNGYALDDELYALNPFLSELSWNNFLSIFNSATFNDKGDIGYDYRPIALASFFMEYLLFGKHVFISHAINLTVYLIVLNQFHRILIKLGMEKNTVLIAMLLFALHPVHTEVVCNLKCRDELLAYMFALTAFRLAIMYYIKPKGIYLAGTLLFFLGSFLSKQTTAAFAIIIPVGPALHFGFDRKKVFYVFTALISAAFIFLLIKKQAVPFNVRSFVYYENPLAMVRNFSLKSSTGLAIALRYLKLLIVPHPLAYYYGYKYVDLSYFREPAVIISIFIHLALIAVLFKNIKKNRQLAFGVFFYLVNIFVFTFFIRKVPGLMAERFLFGASLGYCIVFAILVLKIGGYLNKRRELLIGAITISVLVFYGTLSFKRSAAWKDKETLYSHDMKNLENSAKANLLYGSLLSEQALKERDKDKLEKAIHHLKKATSIVPAYSLAWENLGVLYYFKGDLSSAFSCLDTAILKDSLNGKPYFDKAVIYESLDSMAEAEKFYVLSLKKDPAYIPCYLKLMNLYEKQKKSNKALAVGMVGAKQEKRSDLIYSELTRLALLKGDTLKAIDFSEKAVAINPKNPARIQTLENYFRVKGNAAKADYYRELLQKTQNK